MENRTRFRNSLCAIAAALAFMVAERAPADSVPFVAALSGAAQWDGGPTATCHGTGIGNHLGLTTSQCAAQLNLALYMQYDDCSGEGTGFGFPAVNTSVLTAANGDQLVLVSLEIACEIEPFKSFHVIGSWTADSSSSTGRYAGATGTGDCDANVDFVDGEFNFSFVGELDY